MCATFLFQRLFILATFLFQKIGNDSVNGAEPGDIQFLGNSILKILQNFWKCVGGAYMRGCLNRENKFEIGFIRNNFWSSTIWASQIRLSLTKVKTSKKSRNSTYQYTNVHNVLNIFKLSNPKVVLAPSFVAIVFLFTPS